MTRIAFHFNVDHRLPYACRVTRKARAAGNRLVVYTRDAARLAQFDEALWTFSALDFLPHVRADSPLAADTPILLADNAARTPDSDVLLTLDDEAPPGYAGLFARYPRVIEVVSQHDDDRALARVRLRSYRDSGLAVETHDMGEAR